MRQDSGYVHGPHVPQGHVDALSGFIIAGHISLGLQHDPITRYAPEGGCYVGMRTVPLCGIPKGHPFFQHLLQKATSILRVRVGALEVAGANAQTRNREGRFTVTGVFHRKILRSAGKVRSAKPLATACIARPF